MKYKFVRKIVFLASLLALTFSAWGVTPAQAAILIVTNDSDSGPGSLRQAITNASPGDTITFDGDYAIHLASSLTLSQNVTIDGSGHSVTLSGDTDDDTTPDVRIMVVDPGVTATLMQLTFTKGTATFGGGIYNDGGTLSVTNSTLSGNNANDSGGGIYNDGGTLSVTDSTISGNLAAFRGGGIYINGGALSVTNSTFAGNSAPESGGGIYTLTTSGTCTDSPTVTIANSTFSGNIGVQGAAINNQVGVVSLLYNTITANTGRGVFSFNGGDTCTKAGGNIISGNTSYDIGAGDTTQRYYSLGYNLVGTGSLNVDFTQEFNQTGDQTGVTDPMLAPLADNGGPTQTRAPLAGSPAVDAGDDTACATGPVNNLDQRGVTRPQGNHCDIGAFETRVNITVTNSHDSGPGSLRQAIGEIYPGSAITFAGDFTIRLVSTLIIDKDLTIDGSGHSITLNGDTNGDTTPDVQILYVNPGVTATLKHLTFTKGTASTGGGIRNNQGTLTVTDSTFSDNSADNGSSISNQGTLSVTDSTFSGNSAIFGGGIHNNGMLTVTDSAFTGNSASFRGGGIYNISSGTLSVTGSTFSDNSATFDGGGIYNYTTIGTCTSTSAATISNSTFSNNSATKGSGIYNAGGVITLLFNTITASPSGGGVWSANNGNACTKVGSNIISGNSGYDLGADAIDQRFDSLGYNLVGVAGTNVDFSQEFNQTGDQNGETDPKLGPLANYGGRTKTHALLPGSPAINAGDDTACTDSPINSQDQRGVTRPFGVHCDTGAYELNSGRKTFRSQANYDGWVLESGEFTNKGGTKNNLGKVLQVGDNAQDKQYRVMLSFGTASIPDYAVITKVILKVKRAGVVGKNPMLTHNGLVVDIKKNKFFTLPALQINDFQAKAGKFKIGKFPKTPFSGLWYRAVLYKVANSYINKKGRTQLRLRFLLDDDNDNVADILKLYSGNAILANRPRLIIQYYVP